MRERVSELFERWAGVVTRHPWSVLLGAVALCVAAGLQVPKIVVDTSTEGFLHPDDPILIAYDDFRARFGRDDAMVVAVESDTVFSLPFLDRLRAFHQELEQTAPYLDEITSMVNARWTRGEADQLVVEDLLAEWPASDADLARLRERVYSNPLYLNTLITADGRMTVLQLDLETYVQEGIGEDGRPIQRYLNGQEQAEVSAAISSVAARYDAPDFRVYIGGSPYLVDNLSRNLLADTRWLFALVMAAIGAILLVLFGRLRATMLALTVVVAAVLCTVGLMPTLGITYHVPTQVVPISLLAIGIGDSVHVLAIYYQRRRSGQSKTEAIVGAFGHTGPAILMTSLTTAAAMTSFLSASLAPITNIGILVPIGVMLALAFTMTVLPASLIVLPERSDPAASPARLVLLDRIVVGLGAWSAAHARPVLAATAALAALMLVGALRVEFSHNPAKWFPPGDPVREAVEHMNARLGGVIPVEALFETGEEKGVHDPAFLQALERIAKANATVIKGEDDPNHVPLRVSKTISIVDLVKEINRALNENRWEAYVLPDSSQMVSQELLLFELNGNDDLEDLADYEYRTARMTMRVPWIDATEYGAFLDELSAIHREEVGADVEIVHTGRLPLLARTFTGVVHSMARSYVLAIVAVTPLMMLLLGRVRLGLLAMIPNLLPLVAGLAFMHVYGFTLDGFSLLGGSIVIGLAVDDTIHFMHGFRTNYLRSGDVHDAVSETLSTTGQAMLFTTLILCAGFSMYAFAYMRAPAALGITTAFSLAVALLADIVVAPALVSVAMASETRVARGAAHDTAV